VKLLRALLLAALLAPAAPAVEIGATRAQVLAEIGPPSSSAKRGDREILLYPRGARIELEQGLVVDLRGTLPDPLPPPEPKKSPAPAAAVAEKKPAPPAATAAVARPAPPQPREPSPADFANALGDKIEKMDTAWGTAPPKPKPQSLLDHLPALLAGLVLRFGLTLLALQLAFKFWEMDALWTGKLAIAGIDLALHAVLELLGPVTGGLTTMSAVENGIPGLALIFTIRHFCINNRLQNALLTAAMVKTVTTMLYIFGAVFVLRAMFG
jgi:hypothetical protein